MVKTIYINISSTAPYVEKEKFRIEPEAGDTIVFNTGEGAAAAIIIPQAKCFLNQAEAENENYIQDKLAANKSPAITFTVKNYPAKGIYFYHVFMIDQKEFADNPGHSAPKIVID